jgi:tRNA A37 methylthiotransferase MiaB
MKESTMRQLARQQRSLFEVNEETPAAQLPDAVQREVTQRLSQWLQELAKEISEERGDE